MSRNSACSGVVLVSRARRAGAGIGAVEDREVRMPLDALRHQVDAAAVRVVDGLERIVLGEFPLGLRRERMRAGGREVEVAAEREQRVADRLGVEAPAREARRAIRWSDRAPSASSLARGSTSW